MSVRARVAGAWVVVATVVAVILSGGGGAPDGFANIWMDTNGGTCTRSATPIEYSDAAACSTLDAAWDAINSGETVRIAPGTYGPQKITGDKASDTFLIGAGDSKDDVIFANPSEVECVPTPSGTNVICAQAAFMHLENVTLNSGDLFQQASASQIWSGGDCGGCNAHDVTYKDVDMRGDFVNFIIDAANFTWDGGERGSVTTPPLDCQGGGQPIQIAAANTTLNAIVHNPVNTADSPTCDPHVESIRLMDAANGLTISNNYFAPNSDSHSGHIFTNAGATPDNVTIVNSIFHPDTANGGICQCSNGTNWLLAYNTFLDGFSLGTASNATFVGNVGIAASYHSGATRIENVWQTTGSGGTGEQFIGAASLGVDSTGRLQSGSPAIDAGETPGASDRCTEAATVASRDIDGGTRPNGSVCDSGADEFGS